MSEAVEQLKAIGVEKIHQQTHIPLSFLQAMINHEFEKLSKVQFLGFVAILEREYKLDLDELREAGVAYFAEHEVVKSVDENNLFVPPKQVRDFAPIYLALAGVVFVLGVVFTFQFSSDSQETQEISMLNEIKLPKEIVENNASLQEEDNSSIELKPQTQVVPKEAQKTVTSEPTKVQQSKPQTQEQHKVESFIIQPKVKVWLGYIDMKNYKHYQKTFSSPLALDPSKEWLLTFGHGLVSFEIDGEKKRFSSTKGLKFHYKNGVLEQITPQEFKRFNRGRAW
jgi:hypothetical protein